MHFIHEFICYLLLISIFFVHYFLVIRIWLLNSYFATLFFTFLHLFNFYFLFNKSWLRFDDFNYFLWLYFFFILYFMTFSLVFTFFTIRIIFMLIFNYFLLIIFNWLLLIFILILHIFIIKIIFLLDTWRLNNLFNFYFLKSFLFF